MDEYFNEKKKKKIYILEKGHLSSKKKKNEM